MLNRRISKLQKTLETWTQQQTNSHTLLCHCRAVLDLAPSDRLHEKNASQARHTLATRFNWTSVHGWTSCRA